MSGVFDISSIWNEEQIEAARWDHHHGRPISVDLLLDKYNALRAEVERVAELCRGVGVDPYPPSTDGSVEITISTTYGNPTT